MAPDDRRLIIYSVLLVLTRRRDLYRCANTVSIKNRKFSPPPLIQHHRFRIYRKVLLILKLESSRQLMANIWLSEFAPFLTDLPVWRTNRRTIAAVARKKLPALLGDYRRHRRNTAVRSHETTWKKHTQSLLHRVCKHFKLASILKYSLKLKARIHCDV